MIFSLFLQIIFNFLFNAAMMFWTECIVNLILNDFRIKYINNMFYLLANIFFVIVSQINSNYIISFFWPKLLHGWNIINWNHVIFYKWILFIWMHRFIILLIIRFTDVLFRGSFIFYFYILCNNTIQFISDWI